jgi:uroporphyrinogen III methyltransferase/synthase
MFPGHAIPGCVYIVGAGPGDPGLITAKGLRYLQEADVVLYDDLLDRRLLDLAPAKCEKLYVGKRGGHKSHSQEEINHLLLPRARQGRVVVRLKGGDPLIFGRGAEEALLLKEAGIPFEIVSGVSAASGVPAYAGIPLTHRGLSSVAVLVTGHEDPAKPEPAIDWPRLAGLEATLVIFMAARKVAEICQTLLQHGRAASTPAAIVEWGTWPRQRTVVSDLEHLPEKASERQIRSPALILVGQVVRLRDQLDWFESKPLFGKRVLVTRSRDQAATLQLCLEAQGAEVLALPLLDIAPPEDWSAVDRHLGQLPRYAWVVFTSPNSVSFFFDRLYALGKDARAFGPARVAAVGLSTAEHLHQRGLRPDLVPATQSQEGLAQAFADFPVEGREILLPASSIGRTHLVEVLQQRGALVHHVVAYQNRAPDPSQVELPAALVENALDLVIFASPSSVQHFAGLLGQERALEILSRARIACIGPTTSRAVRDLGLEVHVQPQQSSIPELVQSICAYYAGLGHE